MANVVPLRGEQEERDRGLIKPSESQFIQRALHDLWITGGIRQEAFFLGTQICARFQEYDVFRTALIPTDAASTVVVDDEGFIRAGFVCETFGQFIDAMQDLHFKAGILSHYVDSLLEEPDAHERHFTLDPTTSAEIDFTVNTAYFFKFDPRSMDQLAAKARTARQQLTEDYQIKVLKINHK